MISIVGVRFKKAGKIYYFDPADSKAAVGDDVIVETARGLEMGKVVVGPKQVEEDEVVEPLRKVLRVATEEDLRQLEENQEKEKQAFEIGLEKIEKHKLPMKLVDVEYMFDGSKLIFYFTAEGRIDFRELVKDLAGVFRTRIELRQIGVRDEAKMIGGLGPCGRTLCCCTFLGDFEPVSIRMAKEQELSLNPTKISGICGRLMCCLKFECQAYRQRREEMPDVGSTVTTSLGTGEVTDRNLLKEEVTVQISENQEVALPASEVEEFTPEQSAGERRTPRSPDTPRAQDKSSDKKESSKRGRGKGGSRSAKRSGRRRRRRRQQK